jgi:pyruvate,water dikinase
MPDAVEQEVIEALGKTGSGYAYAVRSSATAEDLAFASFAGQQDTYLNVMGENALLEAVRDCWASLFTDRAILYRMQNQIDHAQVSMSVVVQKMILPEVSGIMFTADPVSGHRGIISIDASYGLGEALVSGLVSPDLYKFRKNGMQIEGKTIAEKKLAIMPVKGGGTQKVEITGEKSTRQVLSDAQIMRLAEIGMAIEKHYGCPQDIEWCLEGDTFYIVQSRAITSLFPQAEPHPQDEALHIYFSFNHIQMMTDPISPLGIDMVRMVIPLDGKVTTASGYQIMASAAGRIYFDGSGLLRYKRARAALLAALPNMDPLSGLALAAVTQRPGFDAQIRQTKGNALALVRIVAPVIVKAVVNLLFKNPDGAVERMNQFIARHEKATVAAIGKSNPGIERLETIYSAGNLLDDFVGFVIPAIAPGVISLKVLERLEQKLLGTQQHVNSLSAGLEGNVTTEMGLLVGDLAELIGKSEQLVDEFKNPDYATLIERVSRLKGQEDFKRAFGEFIEKYGARAAGEIDIANPRWCENPEMLAKSLLAMVETLQPGAHRAEYRATIARAKAAADEFVKAVESKHGKLPALLVARLVRVLRGVLPLREHHKYLMTRKMLVIKRALLDEAKRLVENGQLAEVNDIFYAGYWDLYRAIQNNESLIPLVEQRKAEYSHFAKLNPPRILTSEGEEIKADYNRQDLPAGALAGIPASAGVIEGIARVITDPSKESLNKGEILVAPFTDPGWTPLFINASGLVMEIGGLLTHGTVIAREYGIPAVVGVTDATRIIQTGQRIRVDGNSGFVIVLEEQDASA